MQILAHYWAYNGASQGLAYAGLVLYVALQAFITLPLLHIVKNYLHADHLFLQAGIMTLCLFGGLTAAAFFTRKDFSFLGPIVWCASFLLLGLAICGVLFSFNLGLWFSFALVGLACAFILYDTSNVIHHFRTDQHVPAALALFASVAMLFRQILWILASTQGRD